MKSVGEVMAIGRTFQESLQKALRSLETGLTGLDEITIDGPRPGRRQERHPRGARHADAGPAAQGRAGDAARLHATSEIHAACKIDPWFLAQIRGIVETEARDPRARACRQPPARSARLKAHGLLRRAARRSSPASSAEATSRKQRRALGVRPVYKRIDTCAAEFASPTAYMYSTYETPFAGAAADEARAVRQEEGHDPRRRAEPHRPGHRVRLLLLPRRASR